MKYLVIGSGGREHAIVHKLSGEKRVKEIFVTPGNPGIMEEKKVTIVDILPNEVASLIRFIKEKAIDIVVIGPEKPLEEGIVDTLTAEGIKVFGPSKEAAQLETSKDFAKNLMRKYDIKTANSETFDDSQEALNYVKKQKFPLVIKQDGLAAGKGVEICQNIEEAEKSIKRFLSKKGDSKIVIEDFLVGEEVSVFAFVDGNTIKYFTNARDHKKAYEEAHIGENPMTGGMGTISPVEVSPTVEKRIQEIITKTGTMIHSEKMNYKGIIFIGIMVVGETPYVLEYNVRFGDPETQSILARMTSSLSKAIEKTVENKLDTVSFEFKKKALCIVLASVGYPGEYEKSLPIKGLKKIKKGKVLHAGTALSEKGELVTDGGRVLGVVIQSDDIEKKRKPLYAEIKKITFGGKTPHFRKDIGQRN